MLGENARDRFGRARGAGRGRRRRGLWRARNWRRGWSGGRGLRLRGGARDRVRGLGRGRRGSCVGWLADGGGDGAVDWSTARAREDEAGGECARGEQGERDAG